MRSVSGHRRRSDFLMRMIRSPCERNERIAKTICFFSSPLFLLLHLYLVLVQKWPHNFETHPMVISRAVSTPKRIIQRGSEHWTPSANGALSPNLDDSGASVPPSGVEVDGWWLWGNGRFMKKSHKHRILLWPSTVHRLENRRKSINSFVPKSLTAINFIILCRWTTDYIVNGLSRPPPSTWMYPRSHHRPDGSRWDNWNLYNHDEPPSGRQTGSNLFSLGALICSHTKVDWMPAPFPFLLPT